MQATQSLELKFSDSEVGTDEFGYIPRIVGQDPDDEDIRYQRWLRNVTNQKWFVIDGIATLQTTVPQYDIGTVRNRVQGFGLAKRKYGD